MAVNRRQGRRHQRFEVPPTGTTSNTATIATGGTVTFAIPVSCSPALGNLRATVIVAPDSAGGEVPATLSLTLGPRPGFGQFQLAVAADYTATMAATVTKPMTRLLGLLLIALAIALPALASAEGHTPGAIVAQDYLFENPAGGGTATQRGQSVKGSLTIARPDSGLKVEVLRGKTRLATSTSRARHLRRGQEGAS